MFAGTLLLFLCPGEKASLRRQGKSGWRGSPWPRERGPSDTSYRVAKRSSDRSSARGPCPQVLQWHPRVAKRASIGTLARGASTEALLGQDRVSKERESVPLTGLGSGSRPGLARHPRLQVVLRHPGVAKGTSIGTSARRPCTQAPQWHPRVAKRASIGTLARGPSTEALLGQGRVSKERESAPLTGLWSGSRPGLARHPRLQVVLRHPRVAKRTSIGTSARRPYLQMPQWHPRVAKGLL